MSTEPGLFDDLDDKEDAVDAGDHRIVYFDLETKKGVDDVGGWGNIQMMGMSMGIVYDSLDEDFHVYTEDMVQDLLAKLELADLIVGYNVVRFDYTVLKPYGNIRFSGLNTFDMLTDIADRLGFRLKLDTLARHTLKRGKTADGLAALQWYKEGRMDLIEEYCRADVAVTRDLFLYGVQNKHVIYERKGKEVQIPVDWDIGRFVANK